MKFTFTCKKITLNNSVKEYAEKKISKLDRYFQEDAEAFVTFILVAPFLCPINGYEKGRGGISLNPLIYYNRLPMV